MDIRKTPPIACVHRAHAIDSKLPDPRLYVAYEDFCAVCRRLEAAERAAKNVSKAYVKLKGALDLA